MNNWVYRRPTDYRGRQLPTVLYPKVPLFPYHVIKQIRRVWNTLLTM